MRKPRSPSRHIGYSTAGMTAGNFDASGDQRLPSVDHIRQRRRLLIVHNGRAYASSMLAHAFAIGLLRGCVLIHGCGPSAMCTCGQDPGHTSSATVRNGMPYTTWCSILCRNHLTVRSAIFHLLIYSIMATNFRVSKYSQSSAVGCGSCLIVLL